MLRRLSQCSTALLLTAMLLLGAPRPASACIWDWTVSFSPAPACTVKDQPTTRRIQQENMRIVGKLTTIAAQIQQVEVEVHQWQRAYSTASRYEERLRAVEGDLMTNPLRSMVASYNRTAMASYVRLSTNGSSIGIKPLDIRNTLDSIHDKLTSEANYQRLYPMAGIEFEAARKTVFRTGAALDRQAHSLANWERATKSIRDSIKASGDRNADRYSSESRSSGEAEAQLSLTDAAITNLRATAYSGQAASIQAKMRALQSTAQTRRDYDEMTMLNNPQGFRP